MTRLDHDLPHPRRRSVLREQAFARARNRCEWPRCSGWAAELAHLHSIGMGGRRSADTLDNVAALCWDHARISDQQHGSGGSKQYRQALLDLLGRIPERSIGFEVAEAMRRKVSEGPY